ncbi:hypothetical protein PM082_024867 [Marasmius tenuissimus]|nr:hypothetical protein PM082_024867 [Marasmius tenuissimus]
MATFFANSTRTTFEGTANLSSVHGTQLNVFVNTPGCEVTIRSASTSPTTFSNSTSDARAAGSQPLGSGHENTRDASELSTTLSSNTSDARAAAPQPLGGVRENTRDADEPSTHDPEVVHDQRVPVIDKHLGSVQNVARKPDFAIGSPQGAYPGISTESPKMNRSPTSAWNSQRGVE